MIPHPHPRVFRKAGLAAAILLAMTAPGAFAFEIDTGNEDWAVRFDNTVKASTAQRVEGKNAAIARTANTNDGDNNFQPGRPVNQRLDLLSEFDAVYQGSYGFRASAASWYDRAYHGIGGRQSPYANSQGNAGHLVSAANPNAVLFPAGAANQPAGLSSFAERYYNGPSMEMLDFFLFANKALADGMQLSTKVGRHSVFWGETLFNAANGVNYGQGALDLGKLYNVPGIEAKELFRPRNQISTTLTVTPELTLGAQYFLNFEHSRFPEAGTYMGPYDMLLDGGKTFWLPLAVGGSPVPNAFYGAPRGADIAPQKRGDYGIMAKWSPAWLDGTLGAYYRETTDPLPSLLVNAPNLQLGGVPALAGLNYVTAYGSGIKIFGLSLSRNIGSVSVGADLNYRDNMTLASNFTTVNPVLYNALAGTPNGANLIAAMPGSGNTGLARGRTLHAVVNGVASYGKTSFWDASALALEASMTHLIAVTEGQQTYKGDNSYRGIDHATTDSFGVAGSFTPTWYQVYPGIDLSLPLTLSTGVKGMSAVQLGNYAKAGSYSVGLAADISQKYKVTLAYIDAFGPFKTCDTGTDNNTPGLNGRYQCVPGQITSFAGLAPLLKDRGMVALSVKFTF